MNSLRWGILGSGAVGGLYGGMLAHSGQDVHFLLHSDFEHVSQSGLRIESKQGDFHLACPNVYRRVEDMPPCDVVIVALKSVHNHLLSKFLSPLVAPGGTVLNLQNGLNVEADCWNALANRLNQIGGVLGGCCFLCSNKVGPGHIRHLDYGRIVFGQSERPVSLQKTPTEDPPDHSIQCIPHAEEILDAMKAASIDAHWTDELAVARWRKLMWNIPFNGLSVVLDASTDEIIGCPASRNLADRIIREVHAGAAACGVKVEEAAIEKTMAHTETMVPYDSSMRLDYRHGRPLEIEAILGNPLAAVKAIVSPRPVMPSVEMLYQQLQFLQARSCYPVES